MRRFDPELKTAATAPVLSIEEIRDHCNVTATRDDQDSLLLAYLAAAVSYLEGPSGVTGLCLVEQTWLNRFSSFPIQSVIELTPGKIIAVESVTYIDADGVSQVLSSVYYDLILINGRALLALVPGATWPETDPQSLQAVEIEFTAGFGETGAAVPATIKQAIKLMIGHWYEHREAVVVGNVSTNELPLAVKALLAPWQHGKF